MTAVERGLMETPSTARPLLTDVSIVFLTVVALVQLIQAALSPAGAVLALPSSVIVLAGAYGLYRLKRWGHYVALITSGLQIASGLLSVAGFFLVVRQMPQLASLLGLSEYALLQSAILTVLNLIALICVVKTWHPVQQVMVPPVEAAEMPVSDVSLAVETVNLTKVYNMGAVAVHALRELNLKIRRGEFVAIVGPSGSGKSTLLNMLGALDRPTSGHVLIDGVDISRLSSGQLAKLRNEKIGFVFQAYNLIQRTTVQRNIELPAMVKGFSRSERLTRASSLLEATGIGDKMLRKPAALSGGEQQRVAIARALVNDPAIILADEPTGNVDTKVGMEIVALLRKMNRERGTTIIVVTHNTEVARATDRIVHLRDGTIEREEILDASKR